MKFGDFLERRIRVQRAPVKKILRNNAQRTHFVRQQLGGRNKGVVHLIETTSHQRVIIGLAFISRIPQQVQQQTHSAIVRLAGGTQIETGHDTANLRAGAKISPRDRAGGGKLRPRGTGYRKKQDANNANNENSGK
jgi:hypothetical protein